MLTWTRSSPSITRRRCSQNVGTAVSCRWRAIHLLTDIQARLYGLRGRGRLEPGYFADVFVFDAESIGSVSFTGEASPARRCWPPLRRCRGSRGRARQRSGDRPGLDAHWCDARDRTEKRTPHRYGPGLEFRLPLRGCGRFGGTRPMTHEAATAGGILWPDQQEFRRALAEFATGVTVVTTMVDGKPVGVWPPTRSRRCHSIRRWFCSASRVRPRRGRTSRRPGSSRSTSSAITKRRSVGSLPGPTWIDSRRSSGRTGWADRPCCTTQSRTSTATCGPRTTVATT